MKRMISPSIVAAAVMFSTPAAPADTTGIGLPSHDNAKPIEINADGGIEWNQKSQLYVARGNARAAQGNVAVHADTLTAYYRKAKTGRTDIWRIDARGNVRITSPTQTAYGDNGTYLVNDGVLVLKGKKVRIITPTDKISARDSIEYWEKRNMAVARGDAVVTRDDKRLRADLLTAHFLKDKDGKTRIRKIDAFDNVLISTTQEIVRAKEGVYDVQTGVAKLTGGVKITRGPNQLNGEYAEVNMNTGISRLFAGKGGRVQGLIVPQSGTKTRSAPKQ